MRSFVMATMIKTTAIARMSFITRPIARGRLGTVQ